MGFFFIKSRNTNQMDRNMVRYGYGNSFSFNKQIILNNLPAMITTHTNLK